MKPHSMTPTTSTVQAIASLWYDVTQWVRHGISSPDKPLSKVHDNQSMAPTPQYQRKSMGHNAMAYNPNGSHQNNNGGSECQDYWQCTYGYEHVYDETFHTPNEIHCIGYMEYAWGITN